MLEFQPANLPIKRSLYIIFRAWITDFQKKVVTLYKQGKRIVQKGFNLPNNPTAKMNEEAKINMGKIAALTTMRNKINELSQILEELGEPILSDLTLLPKIHEAYQTVFARRGCPKDAMMVRNRKKFIMVVLYLYSPKALAGDRMRMGLRKAISELFGLSTSTPISDNCAGLIIQYHAYADFRRDVDLIFKEIFATLPEDVFIAD